MTADDIIAANPDVKFRFEGKDLVGATEAGQVIGFIWEGGMMAYAEWPFARGVRRMLVANVHTEYEASKHDGNCIS